MWPIAHENRYSIQLSSRFALENEFRKEIAPPSKALRNSHFSRLKIAKTLILLEINKSHKLAYSHAHIWRCQNTGQIA